MKKTTGKKEKNGILIFVKYPKKGMVKSRLSDIIDEKLVVDLYRNFVEDLLDMLNKTDYSVIICYHPKDAIKDFKKWLGEEYQYIPQIGDNLGERLKNSFIKGFDLHFKKLTVIGSDSPDLPKKIIHESFQSLKNNDSVIGPCEDGGYYLIGFNENSFLPDVFENIPWSTTDVYKKTISIMDKSNQKVHILPIWHDVDTINDLVNIYKKNKNTTFKNSNTMISLTELYKKNIIEEYER
jgi:rSAM/selenodomain-associated transferase 1